MEFYQNPSRVHILKPYRSTNSAVENKSNEGFYISRTYLLLGKVPKEIFVEVKKILNLGKSGKTDNPKLKKYYGPNWREKLGLNAFKSEKKGGDEEPESGEPDSNLESEEPDVFNITVDVSDIENESFENAEPIDLFNEDALPDEEEIEPAIAPENPLSDGSDVVPQTEIQQEMDIMTDNFVENVDTVDIFQTYDKKGNLKGLSTNQINVSDVSIYPEDKISEFKNKIYTVTKIPPFRQHLFYDHKNMIYNLSYQLMVRETRLLVNIRNLQRYETKLHDIPIDDYLYKNRDALKVLGLDDFKTIQQLYSKHGQSDYYLVDLEDFLRPIKSQMNEMINDRYQMDMFYYGFVVKYWPMLTNEAWPDYLKSVDFRIKYPDLVPPMQQLESAQSIESEIVEKLNSIDIKKLPGSHRLAITSAILNVDINRFGSTHMKLNIRNLFDRLRASPQVSHIKVLLSHEGRQILLSKSYKGQHRKYKLAHVNSILIFIVIDSLDVDKYIILQIYDNGKYQIRTTWGEELEMDFIKILHVVGKYINPIIEDINSMGLYVFNSTIRLRKPEVHLIQYTGLNMSIFWKRMINSQDFKIIRDEMGNLIRANIVQVRPSTQPGVLEYYFCKGITEYDMRNLERTHDIQNYYSHLTDAKIKQRWEYLFRRGRLMKIIHRTSDIKIEVQGARETEFDIIYEYMIKTMVLIDPKFSKTKKEKVQKKKLNNLKEQDPEAYDFRRHDSSMVYSRLCQHKDQPVMYSLEEQTTMNEKDKKPLFEYWNFTKQEKAYFACPDPKKPYVSFIVNKHPKDFCLVCCKITPSDPAKVRNQNIKKAQIYTTCQEDHVYSGVKSVKQKSKYIMTYGKDVDDGRISQLPDETIAPLFKDTLYESSLLEEDPNIDVEMCNTKGYYLYGIVQSISNVNNAGAIIAISHALDIKPIDFINSCIKHVRKFGFNVLLNGLLPDIFGTVDDMVHTISYLFMDSSPKFVSSKPFDQWNELFIDMTKLYFQTVVLLFEDVDEDVEFVIPSNVKRMPELIPQNPEFQFIILLKKQKSYYPIYVIEPEKFFKNESVETKLFKYDSGAVLKISNMISHNIEQEEKVADSIDVNIVNDFVKKSKYAVVLQFINSQNLVYGVMIESAGDSIYVPVEYSYHSITNVPVSNLFVRGDYTLKWSALEKYIKLFNEFILDESEKRQLYTVEYFEANELARKKMKKVDRVMPLCPLISANQTISHEKDTIGFVSSGLAYYWNSGKSNLKNLPNIDLLYDPDVVNRVILNNIGPSNDRRLQMLGKSLYENNIYQIVVMEFVREFGRQRNSRIRNELLKMIKQTSFTGDLSSFIQKFNILMADYPEDAQRIKSQINEFYNVHLDRSILIEQINGSYYQFDKTKVKSQEQLAKLASKFVKIGTPKYGEFPNIMVPCSDSDATYCIRDKLVIPAAKLKEIIDIVSHLIQDDYMEKYLTHMAFVNNTRNYFQFEKRPNESIEIEFV